MSISLVKEYLSQWGRDKDVLEFHVSSATVELAAQALSTEPKRIAKSLSFADGDDACIIVVLAGDAKANSGKFKRAFGTKAKMLSHERTQELTGHAVGGVCPFALEDKPVKVSLDKSVQRFESVFPACGSSNSAIELTLPELELYSHSCGWVDIGKTPEDE